MVKRYSHFVVRFFMEKTKIWIEEVLGPVYGVENYYVRFEFAKSRGQIHFHLLAWRHDRKPHGFVGNRCMEHGFDRYKWQSDLGDWFQQLGFTCEHPGGGDTEPMGYCFARSDIVVVVSEKLFILFGWSLFQKMSIF